MTDIVIVPGNVVAGTAVTRVTGTAGATILAGQAVYLDSTVQKYLLADNNIATVEARRAVGIALNGASLNQPIVVQTGGSITIGGTLVAGTAYYLSANPGGICPSVDVVSGSAVCLIGLAASTTVLNISIQFPNVVL
jgi:hypothetical protein